MQNSSSCLTFQITNIIIIHYRHYDAFSINVMWKTQMELLITLIGSSNSDIWGMFQQENKGVICWQSVYSHWKSQLISYIQIRMIYNLQKVGLRLGFTFGFSICRSVHPWCLGMTYSFCRRHGKVFLTANTYTYGRGCLVWSQVVGMQR